MKKILLSALIGTALLSTSAMADADKGQKLYQKKLKEVCGVTGAVFAAKHTQAEWDKANQNGTLKEMMLVITSYSIHYTKLYDRAAARLLPRGYRRCRH